MAETQIDHCPTIAPSFPAPPSPTDNRIIMEAEKGLAKHNTLFEFTGNVSVKRNNQLLTADFVEYNKVLKQLKAKDNLTFSQQGLVADGQSAQISLERETGIIDQAKYFLPELNAHGIAEQFSFERDLAQLEGATYTTCPPEHATWLLKADSITLDKLNNTGSARNISIQVNDIPVLYLPYISFPLQGRKSGLLAPNFGSSSHSGFEMSFPYYLNIAPHRDATLIPRWLARRGLQLAGEYRYLNPSNRGSLQLEHLPNDELEKGQYTLYKVHHWAKISPESQINIDLSQVSQKDYFKNLGTNLSATNQTQLDRHIAFDWSSSNMTLRALVQNFQVLDTTIAEPYRRMPQIHLNIGNFIRRFRYDFDMEYTRFDHRINETAHRFYMEPQLHWSYEKPAGFVRPVISVKHTQYRLKTALMSNGKKSPHTLIPSFSLDTGLFFDKLGKHYTSTLEPRFFYAYVPDKSQTELPVFDSAPIELDYNYLFKTKRYSGNDRVGNMHRFTLGTTYRTLALPAGLEVFKSKLAASYYLKDQITTLAEEQAIDQGQIFAAGEIATALSPTLAGTAKIFGNPKQKQDSTLNIKLAYHHNGHRLATSYRHKLSQLEQVSVAGIWGVSSQWRLAGRIDYSLRDKQIPEMVIGLEYDECCWGFKLLHRRYIQDDGSMSRFYGIQFELKGLTSIGSNLSKRFEQDILGYTISNEGF